MAFRRWRAPPAARPRPWSTASPGFVIDDPEDVQAAADAFAALLDDPARRAEMGRESRRRAVEEFTYDVLSRRLGETLGVFDD